MDGLGLYRRSGRGTVLWPALTDLLPLSSALVMLSCGNCSVHPEEYEYCDSGSVCCEGLVMYVLLCCCHFPRTEHVAGLHFDESCFWSRFCEQRHYLSGSFVKESVHACFVMCRSSVTGR